VEEAEAFGIRAPLRFGHPVYRLSADWQGMSADAMGERGERWVLPLSPSAVVALVAALALLSLLLR
jgi:hypothetical protein